MRSYQPLRSHALVPGGTWLPKQEAPAHVTMDSPALEVMTDLTHVPAATVDSGATLDAANRYMMSRGVRSLFVNAPEGRLQGLVTAVDILGERPLRVAQARGVTWGELRVVDVMAPVEAIAAFTLRDVLAAKVGHVVSSLKGSGRHHALVAEPLPEGGERIRGIFSVTQIARQLGEALEIPELATTFAEVEQALGRGR